MSQTPNACKISGFASAHVLRLQADVYAAQLEREHAIAALVTADAKLKTAATIARDASDAWELWQLEQGAAAPQSNFSGLDPRESAEG